jgi:hypothetical protein
MRKQKQNLFLLKKENVKLIDIVKYNTYRSLNNVNRNVIVE